MAQSVEEDSLPPETAPASRGPLHSLRVVEVGGVGHGPFAAMMLADVRAQVLRFVPPILGHDAVPRCAMSIVERGRPTVTVDLKDSSGIAFALRTLSTADALIDAMRPAVMERLGLGPSTVRAVNPQTRVRTNHGLRSTWPPVASGWTGHQHHSGWGSPGVRSSRRGTDAAEQSSRRLRWRGDAHGIRVLAGVLEARESGSGQVVDAAIVDGVAILSAALHSFRAADGWDDKPGTNLLDLGAHFYNVYETSDGKYLAVGAVEPRFNGDLIRLKGLSPEDVPQDDRARWPELRDLFVRTPGSMGAPGEHSESHEAALDFWKSSTPMTTIERA